MQTQNLIIYSLLFITILTLLIIIFKNRCIESYQPSQPFRRSQPSHIGDEVWWYQIFPQFSIEDLFNFAATNQYNQGLVQRFLQRLNLNNFNEAQLQNAIFFKGANLGDLVNIFNTISPNSAHRVIIKDEEYVLVDQTALQIKVSFVHGYDRLPITSHDEIFIRFLSDEETGGEKNILDTIIYFKRSEGNRQPLFFNALDNLDLERKFDKEQYYYRGNIPKTSGNYYNIINDYPKIVDDEEEKEVVDFNAAKENGQLISVYTPDNILFEILISKGEIDEEIKI